MHFLAHKYSFEKKNGSFCFSWGFFLLKKCVRIRKERETERKQPNLISSFQGENVNFSLLILFIYF